MDPISGEEHRKNELIKETLRQSHYSFDEESLDLLLELSGEVRADYLKERVSQYSEETRTESILQIVASGNHIDILKALIDRAGVKIENTAATRNVLLNSISAAHAEVTEVFLQAIGIIPDVLKAWSDIPVTESEAIREIFKILLSHQFDVKTLGPWECFEVIASDYENDDCTQAKVLFEMGVPYIDDDIRRCPLRKAAVWHKVELVNYFLKGSLHTNEQAANAYELLQIGRLRHIRFDDDNIELEFFRKAREIRDQTTGAAARGQDWDPSIPVVEEDEFLCQLRTLHGIELMEKEMREVNFDKFIRSCFRIVQLNNCHREVFNDRLDVYDQKSWLFFYFSKLRHILSFYIRTTISFVREIQNKFKVKIMELLQVERPNWIELVMLFHAFRLTPKASIAANAAFENLDLEDVKNIIKNDRLNAVGTLILSYCADMAIFPGHSPFLDDIILLLIENGANLYIRRKNYPELQKMLRERAISENNNIYFFDQQYEEDECSDHFSSGDGETTYTRLIHKSRTFDGFRGKRVASLVKKFSCCALDAVYIFNDVDETVTPLRCLCARKIPDTSISKLPYSLRTFVEGHRYTEDEDDSDGSMVFRVKSGTDSENSESSVSSNGGLNF